jgi:hypothetical protein
MSAYSKSKSDSLRRKVFRLIDESDEKYAPAEALLAVRDHAGRTMEKGNDGYKTKRIYDLLGELSAYIKRDEPMKIYWRQEHRGPDASDTRPKVWLTQHENGSATVGAPSAHGDRVDIHLDYQDGNLVVVINRNDGPEYNALLRVQEAEILTDNVHTTELS